MAIVQNPLIGKAAGRAGGFIFQTYNGMKIIRRMPFAPRDPNSPGQQLARSNFALNQFSFTPSPLLLYNLVFPHKPYTDSRAQLFADVMRKYSEIKREQTILTLSPTSFGNGQQFIFSDFEIGFVPDPLSGYFRIYFYPEGYNYQGPATRFLYTFGQYSYIEKTIRIFEKINMAMGHYFQFYIPDVGANNSNYVNFVSKIPINYSNFKQSTLFTLR
jgi:hypothetical protein